ncbi:MAG: hypothetical protein K0R93_1909 [Anaerosolibacter sp.]|uniref:DUF4349 domain-containing protein n=1 Tax=Anaerosolibacter sp. TaxID=1872527 RepID=UPI00260FD40E|nr:DUF4349 domain-containing protein [Anaerosolibacter sp.]MDF2547011.1 hypothetical protein [Anaerosolibacter sp.]
MNCTETMELISLYIDGLLDEHTEQMLQKHFKECAECRQDYEELLNIKNMCSELPMLELPPDFEVSLHEKLVRATENVQVIDIGRSETFNKKFKWKNWKVYGSMAAVFIVLILASSLLNEARFNGSQMKENVGMESPNMEFAGSAPAPEAPKMKVGTAARDESYGAEERLQTTQDNGSPENRVMDQNNQTTQFTALEAESDRKVIKSGYVDLNVEEYDDKFSQITRITAERGGFVENSNTYYKQYNEVNPEESLKQGSLVIRVPENQFAEVLDHIKSLGTVTNTSISGQDITKEYRSTVDEIENLKVQEKSLRAIMEKATSVKDILEVERELSRVRGEINRMSGDVKRWDDLVDLSTIHVTLNEMSSKDKEIYPIRDNVWLRAQKGFIKTVNEMIQFAENVFIRIASTLPVILVLFIMGIPLTIYLYRWTKRKKNKQE